MPDPSYMGVLNEYACTVGVYLVNTLVETAECREGYDRRVEVLELVNFILWF